ncbi:hypothetical protein [Leptospira broomii]|uniref:hypothetical protein n=1 Tax=Leptospira broomii TaxID=301541 RepID=UPI0002890D42|nr:hypothetical protein [Leptospira broomii]
MSHSIQPKLLGIKPVKRLQFGSYSSTRITVWGDNTNDLNFFLFGDEENSVGAPTRGLAKKSVAKTSGKLYSAYFHHTGPRPVGRGIFKMPFSPPFREGLK